LAEYIATVGSSERPDALFPRPYGQITLTQKLKSEHTFPQ